MEQPVCSLPELQDEVRYAQSSLRILSFIYTLSKVNVTLCNNKNNCLINAFHNVKIGLSADINRLAAHGANQEQKGAASFLPQRPAAAGRTPNRKERAHTHSHTLIFTHLNYSLLLLKMQLQIRLHLPLKTHSDKQVIPLKTTD